MFCRGLIMKNNYIFMKTYLRNCNHEYILKQSTIFSVHLNGNARWKDFRACFRSNFREPNHLTNLW